MAASQNFRSAFNGFNREDVVHYLEYLNAKHSNQINQLTAENEALRQQVDSLPQLEDQQSLISALEGQCAELTRQLEAARARCAELEAQLAESDSIICQLKDELDAATANAETSEAAANAGTTEETPKKAGRTTKKSE